LSIIALYGHRFMFARPGYRRLFAAIVGVVALLVVLAQPLPAKEHQHGALYGVATDYLRPPSVDIARLDPVTGTQTPVATLSGNLWEMVADPASPFLYAPASPGYPPVAQMLTIDTRTGSVTVTEGVSAFGLVFDAATHTILGLNTRVDGPMVSTELVRIDPATWTSTFVASLPDGPRQLAFDSVSHTIYTESVDFSAWPTTGRLIAVNSDTGAVTVGPKLDPAVFNLVFDDAAGALFGVVQDAPFRFVQVDPSTGTETAVGNFRFTSGAPWAVTIDSATHTVYFVETEIIFGGQSVSRIATINDETGASTLSPAMAKAVTAIAFSPHASHRKKFEPDCGTTPQASPSRCSPSGTPQISAARQSS
jgi:hypothetical protein